VGPAEPSQASELPAVVLWLDAVERKGAAMGGGATLVRNGALSVTCTVDLANPVLPTDPSLELVSADRRTLILHHGGLVRATGMLGSLSPADLQVTVAGAPRAVVAGAPGAAQVSVDPEVGTLLFGAPLPATGAVVASYFLGQWERRLVTIAGALEVLVVGTAAAVQALSDALLTAVSEGGAPAGAKRFEVSRVGAIAPREGGPANTRQRGLRLRFEYDHTIDRPESSGGVIRNIRVQPPQDTPSLDPKVEIINVP
jgi:hypothetical protein